MTFTPKIRDYLEEKIGRDHAPGFETWALVGMRAFRKKEENGTCIDSWNSAHPRNKMRSSMNVYDAVDRMIEIWKERFG